MPLPHRRGWLNGNHAVLRAAAAGGGGVALAYDSANPTTNVAFTNSDQTVTKTTSNAYVYQRANATITGKQYFEAKIVVTGAAFDTGIGIADATASNNYLGADSHTAGVYDGGQCWTGNGQVSSVGTNLVGLDVLVAVDATTPSAGKIWFYTSTTGWFGGAATNDPTTATGGMAFNMGVPKPMAAMERVNDQQTIRGSSFVNSTQVTALQGAGFTAVAP